MSNSNLKEILFSAAIGTIAGTIGALFLPKNIKDQTVHLVEQASEMGSGLYDGIREWSKPPKPPTTNFTNGAIVGLCIGVGSALLLTPKTGKDLRKNLSKTYDTMAEKTHDLMDYYNNHKPKIKKRIRNLKNTVRSAETKIRSKILAKTR